MLPPAGHLGCPFFPHCLGFATVLVCVANGQPRPWHLRDTVAAEDTQLIEEHGYLRIATREVERPLHRGVDETDYMHGVAQQSTGCAGVVEPVKFESPP